MSDLESKVIVFDKKELFLIFCMVVVLSLISFTIGVKIGRHSGLVESGLTKHDEKSIQILSQQEEQINKIEKKLPDTPAVESKKLEHKDSLEKLKKEFDEINTDLTDKGPKSLKKSTPTVEKTTAKDIKVTKAIKYTIQLGSYNNEKDAVRFADGFRVRGYNPIISEVFLPSKGIWYRVSLGMFPSINDAKKYIDDEKSLFNNQDYIITELK